MWLGCIVTHRAVIGMFAAYSSLAGPKLAASIPCPQVWAMIENVYGTGLDAQVAWSDYPTCVGLTTASNGTLETFGLVYGDFLSGKPEEQAAALYLAFGPAFWVATLIHVTATEVYLKRDGGRRLQAKRLVSGLEGPAQSVDGKEMKTR